jgi:FkbM family methyltransferase
MMNPLKPLMMPEYFFRPTQIIVRLKRAFFAPARELEPVRLPWGATILIRPAETIGSNIWYYGVFDLIVAEAIDRLLDAGETAIDIGANIGQMTSLMRRKAGEIGNVYAFEPHPEIFAELSANMQLLNNKKQFAPVSLYNLGLSDREGPAEMEIDPNWANNRGLGKIATPNAKLGIRTLKIQLDRLDKILGPDSKVDLCKMDVEGHELKVAHGAAHLLSEGRIRDIIFEDQNPYPSELQKLFLDGHYTIFSMHHRLLAPLLLPIAKSAPLKGRDRPDFLATLNPKRAVQRFMRRGWRVLM